MFVGYSKKIKEYYFYHPTEQNVIVSRHAIFLEKEFIQEGGSGKNIELKEVQDLQSVLELPTKVSQPEVPVMWYIQNLHLLYEGQIECIMHPQDMVSS